MPRRPVALVLSVIVHAALGAVVLTGAGAYSASPRVVQLNGSPQERPAGRDLLRNVLRSPGVGVRLESPDDGEAVGLAWWSPGEGMWLATDLFPPETFGTRFHVSLRVEHEPPARVGNIVINNSGSGRIVAGWTSEHPVPGTEVTLSVIEAGSWWPWSQPATIVTGTAVFRHQ